MEEFFCPTIREQPRVLKVLEALKQASRDVRIQPNPDPDDCNSSAIKALLELHTSSDPLLSSDPHLSSLSVLLARLRTLVHSSRAAAGHGLGSFLTRRVSAHFIARVAESIESELQAWIDRETVETLARALRTEEEGAKIVRHEDELVGLLTRLEDRVAEGFNRELQDLILKWKIFASLETILLDPTRSKRLRELSASLISALIRFNKDVFVGEVPLGPTVKALTAMSTTCSMKVLSDLVRSVKSPLVDELEPSGAIAAVVSSLGGDDPEMRALAFECALEIGYFGRKEAIDAMLRAGLVERLVALQRRAHVGPTGARPRGFEGAVARFAVSLEVGEGLRQREKRALKLEILERVRVACGDSEAESATIVAEVLWGSSP